MNNITVNPNHAQNVTVNTEETFETFRNRVYKQSHPLRFADGKLIELEPGSKNAVISLKLSEIATSAQFDVLLGIIMQSVAQATESGVISPGWLLDIATLFNLTPPEVPEQFEEEGFETKAFWTGEGHYNFIRTPVREPVEEEEADAP